MRYLLDTNIVSNLVRNPRGHLADRIKAVGEQNICTSIIVAAELRYGTTKKASPRLSTQVEAVLGTMETFHSIRRLTSCMDRSVPDLSRPAHRSEVMTFSLRPRRSHLITRW